MTATDWGALGTAVQNQIDVAIPAILPVAGVILAVFVGWKIIKRFLH